MRRVTVLLLALSLVAAACGTRLDDVAFEQADAADAVPGTGDQRRDEALVGGLEDGLPPPPEPTDGSGPAQGSPGTPDATPDSGAPASGASGGGEASPGQPAQPAPPGGDGQTQAANTAPNTASDVGVTATTLKVGNITSRGGPLGPHQMTPPYFGANAYFQLVNARGGVHGRQIEFVTCDDREDPSENIRCAQQMVEQEEVFALAGMSTRSYAGARYMSEQGVPDIAGIPIGNEYYTYPGLYGMYSGRYPRDGVVGDNGTMYSGTSLPYWFRHTLDIEKAAVFYYSIAISKEAGQNIARGLRHVGVETVEYEINPGLPNYTSAVIDMERNGAQLVMHAMDEGANRNLCRALQQRDYQPKAVVPTIAGWNQAVGSQFPDICREVLYVAGNTVPASDTSVPQIAEFRDTMRRVYGGQFEGRMHQWHFEGWLGAKLFVEAVERMGPNVTRRGLMDYMESLKDYTWGGLAVSTDWQPRDWSNPPTRACVVIAKWDDAAGDFVQIAGLDNCLPIEFLPYEARA